MFQRACGRHAIEGLGNARFARTIYEKACTSRDVRAATLGETPTREDLITLTARDVHKDTPIA